MTVTNLIYTRRRTDYNDTQNRDLRRRWFSPAAPASWPPPSPPPSPPPAPSPWRPPHGLCTPSPSSPAPPSPPPPPPPPPPPAAPAGPRRGHRVVLQMLEMPRVLP